jgi:hypothetical protein
VESLLKQQQILIARAQRWDASEIRQLYEELSKIAAEIAALWLPERLSNE